ncbi:MAG: hypothetical protein ACREOE_01435 [Gemmatimonadales bacterium]
MRFTIGLLVLAIGVAPQLGAQAPAPAVAVDHYTAMQKALRDLVVLEERYYADHGTYTTDQAALGAPTPKTHAEAVKQGYGLAIVQAGGRGWWAQAQLSDGKPTGCVTYVGELKYFGVAPTTPAGTPAATDGEGTVKCDGI